MKKLLVVALAGTAIVGVAVAAGASKASTPEAKMCTKMGELCGENASAKNFDRCVDDMTQARKMAGDAAFERSRKCVDESSSCAAAAGCMAGGVGVGAFGELMKGFGNAISK